MLSRVCYALHRLQLFLRWKVQKPGQLATGFLVWGEGSRILATVMSSTEVSHQGTKLFCHGCQELTSRTAHHSEPLL